MQRSTSPLGHVQRWDITRLYTATEVHRCVVHSAVNDGTSKPDPPEWGGGYMVLAVGCLCTSDLLLATGRLHRVTCPSSLATYDEPPRSLDAAPPLRGALIACAEPPAPRHLPHVPSHTRPGPMDGSVRRPNPTPTISWLTLLGHPFIDELAGILNLATLLILPWCSTRKNGAGADVR